MKFDISFIHQSLSQQKNQIQVVQDQLYHRTIDRCDEEVKRAPALR